MVSIRSNGKFVALSSTLFDVTFAGQGKDFWLEKLSGHILCIMTI